MQLLIDNYLKHCEHQKQLSTKTLKAYQIDLRQFSTFVVEQEEPWERMALLEYIAHLHASFQPKTAKRKIASLKAFCAWLTYEELLSESPFQKIQTKFREPFRLPRTIPIEQIQLIFNAVYLAEKQACTPHQRMVLLRDAAVLELLFATGVRVSELCSLQPENVNLTEGFIKIYGKGAKERLIQIGNADVLAALQAYQSIFAEVIQQQGWFFINRLVAVCPRSRCVASFANMPLLAV